MATLTPSPKMQFFDANGNPLVGGKLYTYAAGTTTPLATYTDSGAGTPNANPIILDSRGEASVWLGTSLYYMELKTSADVLVWTADNIGGIATLSALAASGGSALIGFLQSGSGAVATTVQAKLRDRVSVKDFGAVGDGATDDSTAVQNAVNTGKEVFFPNGLYKILTPITVATAGQRLVGESSSNTYFVTAAATTNDILRINAFMVDVSGFNFRPTSTSNICLRIYGGQAHIHGNRFLAASANSGTAVILTDTNPVGGGTISGAYNHLIEGNSIGSSTFEFARGIDSSSATNGQQANRIINNQILSDNPIRIEKGGGNFYAGNLLQSSTGTIGTPVGTAIELGANVFSDVVYGNYMERFVNGTLIGQLATTYIAADVFGNNYDSVTNPVYSLGSTKYYHRNDTSLQEFKNGWVENYSSQDNLTIAEPAGGVVINYNRASLAAETRISGHTTRQTMTYTADSQTVTPTSSFATITGGGAARANCLIGNGARDGQHLYLYGLTWAVQILNTNAIFNGSAASVTFGSAGGNIAMMHLIWSTDRTKWIEASRSIV